MFALTVQLTSNPDRDRTDWEESHTLTAPTMSELRKLVAKLQEGIGGGNWGEATLSEDGNLIGYMSWNGRIWKNRYWENNSFDEVILPNDNF
jgi:hypothetical protein